MIGVIEKKGFSSICIVDNLRWHRSVGSGGGGDAFSIGSSLTLDDEEGEKKRTLSLILDNEEGEKDTKHNLGR